MFFISFSEDNHIISYSSDAWHTEENCIKLALEHILCSDGTIQSLAHWNLPMSKAIVISFLDLECSSTIQ